MEIITFSEILFSQLFPVLLGIIFLYVFKKNFPRVLLWSALAYGIGAGILGQGMLLLAVCKIKFSLPAIVLPLCSLGLIVFMSAKRGPVAPLKLCFIPATKGKGETTAVILFGLFISYYVFFVLWRALNIPILAWDAIATVAFKAKVFFYEGGIQHLARLPQSSYPLHVSFMQTWIALNLGRWDEFWTKLVFPCYFLSFLIIFYYFLRVFTNRAWSLLGVALLISSHFFTYHATIGYRDFTLLYYNCVSLMMMFLWYRTKENLFLWLTALFSGVMTFVKMEGMIYLFIHTVLLCLIIFRWEKQRWGLRRKWESLVKFMAPGYGIFFVFFGYKLFSHLGLVKAGTAVVFDGKIFFRISIITQAFWQEILNTGNWNVLWLVLLASLAFKAEKKSFREIQFFLSALGMFLCFYFLLLFCTPFFLWVTKETYGALLSRLLLHCYPIVPMLIIFLNCPSRNSTVE